MDEAIKLGEETGRRVGSSGVEEAIELSEETGHRVGGSGAEEAMELSEESWTWSRRLWC